MSCEIEQGEDNLPRFVTRAGKFTAEEAATEILKKLRSAPSIKNATTDAVTVSVPVTAGEPAREATIRATNTAGFSNVTLIEEPCAAALAYEFLLPQDGNVFVFDLGGGTYDSSLVEVAGNTIEVINTKGVRQLGGQDFNRCLQEIVLQTFQKEHDYMPEIFRLGRCALS